MKKITYITLALTGITPLISHAVTLDVRGGYKEASHTYESRFKMSQSWDPGFWLSMETDNKQGTDSFQNQSVSDYNEIEGNYKYKVANNFSITPGTVYHWSSNGAQVRPYVKFLYNIDTSWYTAIRFRYDWNQYDSKDIYGDKNKGSIYRVDLYLGWKNGNWQIEDNPVWYQYANDFYFNNNKRQAYENDLIVRYSVNKTWSPYVEWDYMGQQGSYDGRKGLTENRYRVGVSINL